MLAFRAVVSVLVRFVVRTFSTNSRPALRAAASGGRPRPADDRIHPPAVYLLSGRKRVESQNSLDLQVLLAEYDALRQEIVQRIGNRAQLLVASLTVSGLIIGVGLGPMALG
jgi:hypothetical protein